jgi:hypothetical protein
MPVVSRHSNELAGMVSPGDLDQNASVERTLEDVSRPVAPERPGTGKQPDQF